MIRLKPWVVEGSAKATRIYVERVPGVAPGALIWFEPRSRGNPDFEMRCNDSAFCNRFPSLDALFAGVLDALSDEEFLPPCHQHGSLSFDALLEAAQRKFASEPGPALHHVDARKTVVLQSIDSIDRTAAKKILEAAGSIRVIANMSERELLDAGLSAKQAMNILAVLG